MSDGNPSLDEARLERLARVAARVLLAPPRHHGGQRPRPHPVAAGIEFHEHRPLAPGDDPRHIDWRASARAREPQVRRYRDERAARWVLCLDRSASMGPVAPGVWPLAIALTGALAYVLVALEHQVGLALFSTSLDRYQPPGRGRGAYLAIRRLLAEAQPREQGGASQPAACLPLTTGTQLAMVSDFLAPDAMAGDLEHLDARAPGLHALQILGPPAALMGDLPPNLGIRDAETGEHLTIATGPGLSSALAQRQEALAANLAHRCHRRGIVHSLTRVGTPWDQALLAHLLGPGWGGHPDGARPPGAGLA